MSKTIKKELIGSKYSISYNGVKFSGTISDTPENIDLYTKLGLNVFTYVPKSDVETVKKKNVKANKKHD